MKCKPTSNKILSLMLTVCLVLGMSACTSPTAATQETGQQLESTMTPAEQAEWWGEYTNDDGDVYISNFNGESFSFSIEMKSGGSFDGVAALLDNTTAEYMDLQFVFDKQPDMDWLQITQVQERDDSADRAEFTGVFRKK